MRFLADENVSRAVADRLSAAGHDVMSVARAQPGASDRGVLKMAESEGCILITEDRDFGELVIRQRLRVGGVILLELDRLSNRAEADLVAEIVDAHTDKLSGNLLVIEPSRIRIRPLPQ